MNNIQYLDNGDILVTYTTIDTFTAPYFTFYGVEVKKPVVKEKDICQIIEEESNG